MVCHGMASFARETFTVRSDGFQIAVCKRCGATRDGDRPCGSPSCRWDGGEGDRVDVEVPYAFNLFRQELDALGIGAKLLVDDTPAASRRAARRWSFCFHLCRCVRSASRSDSVIPPQ